MNYPALRASIALALVCLSAAVGSAQTPPPQQPPNELDAFMEKVLARRAVNRQTLEQYILDDVEVVRVTGPGRVPLFTSREEYVWFLRDGLHVRSPSKVDGVSVGEDDRRKYEEDWIRRERARLDREAKRAKEEKDKGAAATQAPSSSTADESAIRTDTPVPTPRFVSEAYFMDFKFDPGNYYLAGREQLEGKDVLRIEYYPTRMFRDEAHDGESDEAREARRKRDEARQRSPRREKRAQDIERQLNKTALVTLWVDPAEYQIVKYTFDNVWMDFLPGGWLVKVDDVRASMSMGQPFPGIWLPRAIDVHVGFTTAPGSIEVSYGRELKNYKLGEVTSKIRVPKLSHLSVPECQGAEVPPCSVHRDVVTKVQTASRQLDFPETSEEHGPFAGAQAEESRSFRLHPSDSGRLRLHPSDSGRLRLHPSDSGRLRLHPSDSRSFRLQAEEIIREVRVHGNATLVDDEVIRLAGVRVGAPLPVDGVDGIAQRLKQSGRFESVDVRKRYRSLTDTSDVAIVLVVHERAGVTNVEGGGSEVPGPFARLKRRLMFLPVLGYEDGYGLTYGARVSTKDLLGIGEHLSVPATWGGTRRVALEFGRDFRSGPLTHVESSIGIQQRENPRFEIDDQRVEWRASADREFVRILRTTVSTSHATIDFGGVDDRLWTLTTQAALDTRADPQYPRNAVYASVDWTGLNFRTVEPRIDRYTTDFRGYLGVVGQVVAAGRVQYISADATLPPYERLLLGGASSLRGFRAGAFDGDRRITTSAEVRVPLTSVMSGAKLGVIGFVDAAKIYDAGVSASAAEWRKGVGGGVFLIAPIISLNLDVAHGLENGDTRVHFATGFSF